MLTARSHLSLKNTIRGRGEWAPHSERCSHHTCTPTRTERQHYPWDVRSIWLRVCHGNFQCTKYNKSCFLVRKPERCTSDNVSKGSGFCLSGDCVRDLHPAQASPCGLTLQIIIQTKSLWIPAAFIVGLKVTHQFTVKRGALSVFKARVGNPGKASKSGLQRLHANESDTSHKLQSAPSSRPCPPRHMSTCTFTDNY